MIGTPKIAAMGDLIFAKNGWAKQSKMREAKLRVKNKNLKYFDAKLRFALFWSLSPQGLKFNR